MRTGISWWLVMGPLAVLAVVIVAGIRGGEYYPVKETSFMGWWSISIVTVYTLAMVVWKCWGTTTGWIVLVLTIALAVGVVVNCRASIKTETKQVRVKGRSATIVRIADPHFGLFTLLHYLQDILEAMRRFITRDQAPFVVHYVQDILEAVRQVSTEKQIHFVVLTGDNIGLRSRLGEMMFKQLLEGLEEAAPGAIIVAIKGGHEVEFNKGVYEQLLEDFQVVHGENEWIEVNGIWFWLGGDKDHKSTAVLGPDLNVWRQKLRDTMPSGNVTTVILTHEPDDVDPEAPWIKGADIALAGHKHHASERVISGVPQYTSRGMAPAAEAWGWGTLTTSRSRPVLDVYELQGSEKWDRLIAQPDSKN